MIATAAIYLAGVIVALVVCSCLMNKTPSERAQSIHEEFDYWKNQ